MAADEAPGVEEEELTFDASLVGRRIYATLEDASVCAGTIVDYNADFDGPFFIHFDDGATEEVELPLAEVEVQVEQATKCACGLCKPIYGARGRHLPISRRRRGR